MASKAWTRLDGSGFLANRTEWDLTSAAWKTKRTHEPWSFHVKTDPTPMLEGSGGSAATGSRGPQYGGAVQPDYAGWVAPATQPYVIADLFRADTTSSNLIRLTKETTETDGTDTLGEGVEAGHVVIQVTSEDAYIRDTTAIMAVSEDFLRDAAPAAAYLASRLTTLCLRKEQNGLINGNGTGTTLLGVLNAADTVESATTRAQGADPLQVAIAKLMQDVFTASGVMPTWVLMNSGTYLNAVIERASATGPFLSGGSFLAQAAPFGLRLALSDQVPVGNVVVGSSDAGTRFVHTSGVEIAQSEGYSTFYGAGLVAVRGKLRSAVSFDRPSAIGVLTVAS